MKKVFFILLIPFLVLTINADGSALKRPNQGPGEVAIMTSAIDYTQIRLVDVLIKSLRKFGGEYSTIPVYVVVPEKANFPCDTLKNKKIILQKIEVNKKIAQYPFAFKALAAAKVEETAGKEFNTLIWFDPGVVVLGELDDLDLGKAKSSAVLRTVSLNNNIGLTRKDSLNEYWGRIYRETGLKFEDVPFMTTIVDRVEARAYINCQVYSVSPKLGLLKKWANLLEKLIMDEEYQTKACSGFWSKVFLHQAVFSGLVMADIPLEKIHKMPLKSNYPVNHVKQMDPADVIEKLNDVNVAVFDERWARDPNWMDTIKMDEPLKKWFFKTYLEYIKLSDNLYRIEGSCNSYLVTTREGSVLIDPNGASFSSQWFKKIMKKYPLKVILITHAHKDHWDNMKVWKTSDKIKIIAQREFLNYIKYKDRLSGFFARRNAIWRRKPIPEGEAPPQQTKIEPNFFFADSYKFELGGTHFELYHTPGECPDHTTIWIPELEAVFVGDNYYAYFINNATFRGTTVRPMLGYMNAIKKALDFKPKFFLPGHDKPIIGKDHIKNKVTKFYNTLEYIHNETVKGMNRGKDVYTLMQQIKLPSEYQIAPFYGKVSWTVRGIYNEYASWFDENPATMYSLPSSSVYSDIVKLTGGADKILKIAGEYLIKKEYVKTLHLTQIVLTDEPENKKANEIRLKALKGLKAGTYNYIERIWLDYGIRSADVNKKK
jgi:glyoxylase-like metal-dependent hydrolase (beta-lactamase superfamily II)